MSNIKIVYGGTVESDSHEHELRAFLNFRNEIFIDIEADGGYSWIALDKKTAIRFVKDLKREIAKIEEGGEHE